MELVKTQMQVGGQTSIAGSVRTILERAGPRGLARGLGVTLTREAPAFAAYFGSYELIVRYRRRERQNKIVNHSLTVSRFSSSSVERILK
jgi:hypothetical protein